MQCVLELKIILRQKKQKTNSMVEWRDKERSQADKAEVEQKFKWGVRTQAQGIQTIVG